MNMMKMMKINFKEIRALEHASERCRYHADKGNWEYAEYWAKKAKILSERQRSFS